MSEETFLSDDFLRQLIGVGDLDLVVGVPSYNDAKTIVSVLRAVEEGVLRNFRRERVVLLNVDGGSGDGTQEVLLEASSLAKSNESAFESLRTVRWITTQAAHNGSPAGMLRTILAAADLLHAKACAVIAASSKNATPAWVVTLLEPICRDKYDFVAPVYSRHKFDGLLSKNLLYPISRALYGKPIREMRASEFAFSGSLATHCLAQQEWQGEAFQGGAEMWMAMNAFTNSFRCCQTYLGPKPHQASGANVVAVVRQTVSGLFSCMESTESLWQAAAENAPLHTVGPDHDFSTEAIRIDRNKFLQMFKAGANELSGILEKLLAPATHAELMRLAGLDAAEFQFANSLWARVVYEFAAAYHRSVMNREHLVQALVPLYRGRVYSFITKHRSSDAAAVEADLEALCQEFANQKPYLVERWNLKEEGSS
ncbi:MAG TPA: hypothetical protein VL128_02310 [Candidatus Eisenbacteria bacterium]|nr:hypothetical protein [Candidatus Eisenbacteria bacterium]